MVSVAIVVVVPVVVMIVVAIIVVTAGAGRLRGHVRREQPGRNRIDDGVRARVNHVEGAKGRKLKANGQ